MGQSCPYGGDVAVDNFQEVGSAYIRAIAQSAMPIDTSCPKRAVGVDVEGVIPCRDGVGASPGDEGMHGGLGGTEYIGCDEGVLVVGVRGHG